MYSDYSFFLKEYKDNIFPCRLKKLNPALFESAIPVNEARQIEGEITPAEKGLLETPSFLVYVLFYCISKNQGNYKVVDVREKNAEILEEKFKDAINAILKGNAYKYFMRWLTLTGYKSEQLPTFRDWIIYNWFIIDKGAKSITEPISVPIETFQDPNMLRQHIDVYAKMDKKEEVNTLRGPKTIYKYTLIIKPIEKIVLRAGVTKAEAIAEIRKQYPDFNAHETLYSLGQSLADNNENAVTENGYVVFTSVSIPVFAVRSMDSDTKILFIEGFPDIETFNKKTIATYLKSIYRDENDIHYQYARPISLLNWMLNPEIQYNSARKYKTHKATKAYLDDEYFIEILIDSKNPNKGSYRVDDGEEGYIAYGPDVNYENRRQLYDR